MISNKIILIRSLAVGFNDGLVLFFFFRLKAEALILHSRFDACMHVCIYIFILSVLNLILQYCSLTF